MRWAGHVARGGEKKVAKFLWGNLKKRDGLRRSTLIWKIIMK
jgi:hypothetical protein